MFLIILFTLVCSSFSFSQIKDNTLRAAFDDGMKTWDTGKSIITGDTVNFENQKLKRANLQVGFQAGSHSTNLTEDSFVFNKSKVKYPALE